MPNWPTLRAFKIIPASLFAPDFLAEPEPGEGDGTKSMPVSVVLFVLLLVVVWAANSVLIKVVVRDIPPLWAAALRFTMALAVVAVFARVRRVPLSPERREWPVYVLLGLIAAIQIFLFNTGSGYTTGGRVTLFLFTYPLIVPFLAHFILVRERLTRRIIAGSGIAFIGVFTVVGENFLFAAEHQTFKGDLMEMASSLCLAAQIVLTKRVLSGLQPLKLLFWQLGVSTTLYYLFGAYFENFHASGVRGDAVLCLLFQGVVVGGFCFIAWQMLLSRYGSSQLSVYFFLTPVFGVLLGCLLFHEKVTALLGVGGLLVCAGIFLVNSGKLFSPRPRSD